MSTGPVPEPHGMNEKLIAMWGLMSIYLSVVAKQGETRK